MAEMTHSRLGASSCKRWLSCPGSVSLLETLPAENRSSIYAAEGTCAHAICEDYLRYGLPMVSTEANGRLGEKVEVDDFEIKVTAEMLDACYLYAETIYKDMVAAGITYDDSRKKYPVDKRFLNIEQKFTIEEIDKELSGTNDASVWDYVRKKLTVYDFKYGKGVPVEAEHNEQLMFYALGILSKNKITDYNEVELVIIQPRCNHEDGPIRRWVASKEVMDAFADQLRAGVKAVRAENPEFHSGAHCRWCNAKVICPKYRAKINEAAQMDFAPVAPSENKTPVLEPPKVESLSVDQIANIMKLAPMVQDFIKEVEEKAMELLNQGLAVPGFKLVQKRATRKWIDEEQVALAFGEIAYDAPKIKSPAQLEKLVGKDKVQDFVMTPDSGVTVVPESDKRQAVIPVQQAFDCIESNIQLDI